MNIFIDTQDMEERYGEELYKEYLEKQNQQLKKERNKMACLVNDLQETLEEIREYIMNNIENNAGEGTLFIGEVADLLQIIDKGVNND